MHADRLETARVRVPAVRGKPSLIEGRGGDAHDRQSRRMIKDLEVGILTLERRALAKKG